MSSCAKEAGLLCWSLLPLQDRMLSTSTLLALLYKVQTYQSRFLVNLGQAALDRSAGCEALCET